VTGGAVAVFRSAARASRCELALQEGRALGIGLHVGAGASGRAPSASGEVRADDSVNVLNGSEAAGTCFNLLGRARFDEGRSTG
jgi:hypothetical protein